VAVARRRSLAAGCWGGKASGARAVFGVAQVCPVEDRCGLTSWRLCFDDKVVGRGLEGGGGARGAAARGGAVVWLGRRRLSSRARRAEG
jgi:hypothetical protein